MTSPTERRTRILRVRAIERRRAEYDLGMAQARVRNVSDLANRIGSLRCNNATAVGECSGADLHATSQMATRLDKAQRDITAPLRTSIEQRTQQESMFVAAKQRENGMEKLVSTAVEEKNRRLEQRVLMSMPMKKRNIQGDPLP